MEARVRQTTEKMMNEKDKWKREENGDTKVDQFGDIYM